MLLYVDDILIIGADDVSIQNVKLELTRHLDLKDLGSTHSFLGILFASWQ